MQESDSENNRKDSYQSRYSSHVARFAVENWFVRLHVRATTLRCTGCGQKLFNLKHSCTISSIEESASHLGMICLFLQCRE
jgi:hypothetical protein